MLCAVLISHQQAAFGTREIGDSADDANRAESRDEQTKTSASASSVKTRLAEAEAKGCGSERVHHSYVSVISSVILFFFAVLCCSDKDNHNKWRSNCQIVWMSCQKTKTETADDGRMA